LKDKLGLLKILAFCLAGMLLCAFLLSLALHDKLHADSVKGAVFEQVAGTSAFNAVWAYGAMFGFITCALGFLLTAFVGARQLLSSGAKAARKAARRAAWEEKQGPPEA
jgi:hypothetical protein